MNVTHAELREIAAEFLGEHYDLELKVPIMFNSRIKRCLGRVIIGKVNGKPTPKKIEMSTDFMLNHPKEHIIDVFKHELVHYALCILEKPYKDGQAYFENELKRLGVSATRTYEYNGQVHVYVCEDCGLVFKRRKKLPKTAYCSCKKVYRDNLKYTGFMDKEEAACYSNSQ